MNSTLEFLWHSIQTSTIGKAFVCQAMIIRSPVRISSPFVRINGRTNGEIIDGNMVLNEIGRIVQKCWREIPVHFSMVRGDEFIIMPNHIHGVVVINERRGTACRAQCNKTEYQGTACRAPTVEQFGKPTSGSIATIIRSFKSASTKQINAGRNTLGIPIWQRNYWERVIRSEREMQSIRQYIRNNPAQWQHDDCKCDS